MFTNNRAITSFKELVYFSNLKTLGRYFVWNCSNLKEIQIPGSVTTIGNGAFIGTSKLTKVYFYPPKAPSLGTDAFGREVAQSMGYNTRNAGTNEFHVPIGATGYNSGLYSGKLQDTSYCGFTIIYDL